MPVMVGLKTCLAVLEKLLKPFKKKEIKQEEELKMNAMRSFIILYTILF